MNNVISDLQHLALLEGDLLVARANVRQGIGTERLLTQRKISSAPYTGSITAFPVGVMPIPGVPHSWKRSLIW